MARNFDGTTQHISCVTPFSLLTGNNYTALCRFKQDDAAVATETLINIVGLDGAFPIHLRIKTGGNTLNAFVRTQPGAITADADHGGTITTGVWSTGGVRRAGDNTYPVLNGVIGTVVNVAHAALSQGQQYDIGGNGPGLFFDGDIQDVAIWDATLTQEELDAYHAGVSPLLIRPTKLISYYPLWGAGAGEADISGVNSPGVATLNNAPAAVVGGPVAGLYKPKGLFYPSVGVLTPYNPPLGLETNLNLTPAGYVAPVVPNVDFEFVPQATVLRTGELGNVYAIEVADQLNLGELGNKYAIAKATLSEFELLNKYAVEAFVLAQGELSNKYTVAKALLALGELLNKYGIDPIKLAEGELGNRYAIDAFRLNLGELSNKYEINPAFLALGELQNQYRIDVLQLAQGELHNEYAVQDAKLEAQLLSLYSIRFAKQFESIYGVTVAAQLLAEAYYTVQKQFESPYQIRTEVAQQLDSIFDITNTSFVKADINGIYSMARVTQQLDGSYSIGPVVRAQMDAPYILATVPVENQLDSIYDIKITNPVTKQHKGIYAILTTQIINITGQPTVTLGGEVLDISEADISIDEGSFVWRANIGILDIEDYVKFSINDDIILDLYGETFNLVIESKNLTRSGPAEVDMGLVAVSPAIKFDFPRATALDLTFTSPIFAEAAAEQALGGEDIDWQILDWLIPANRLAIKDGSPIQLVKNIVEAAGGILESKPDGQLIARPLFPVSLPDFDTAPLDQTYSDASDNLSVSESFAPTKRLNLFRILDITASKRDSIEFELDDDSITEGDLRLFPSPFETNRIVKSSRGTEVGFVLVGVETEQREQQVEFKEGFATLSRPIESIDSVVWEAADLGGVTFTQGDNKVFSASVVNFYSLATITYTTRFIKYRVTGVPETDVQFRVELT